MPIAGSTHGAYPPVGRITPAVGLYHKRQRSGDNCAHAGHDSSAATTVGSNEKEADGHLYVLFGSVIVPLYPSPEA